MKGNGFLWVTGAASACVLAACFYMIWSGWTINPANCGEYRVLSIHSQERGLIVNYPDPKGSGLGIPTLRTL